MYWGGEVNSAHIAYKTQVYTFSTAAFVLYWTKDLWKQPQNSWIESSGLYGQKNIWSEFIPNYAFQTLCNNIDALFFLSWLNLRGLSQNASLSPLGLWVSAVEAEGVKAARRGARGMSLSCLFGLAFASGEWKRGAAVLLGMNGALTDSTHFSQRKRAPHQREVTTLDNWELIIHVELSRNAAVVQHGMPHWQVVP